MITSLDYVRTLGEFFSNPIAKLTLLHESMPETVHNQHMISVHSSTYTFTSFEIAI